jgi:hypothetical protein
VDIDISDATAEQSVAIDKVQHFPVCGDDGSGQVRQRLQHGPALSEGAQGEFPDNEGMRQNHPGIE